MSIAKDVLVELSGYVNVEPFDEDDYVDTAPGAALVIRGAVRAVWRTGVDQDTLADDLAQWIAEALQ